jgi:CHAT domain-containing protein
MLHFKLILLFLLSICLSLDLQAQKNDSIPAKGKNNQKSAKTTKKKPDLFEAQLDKLRGEQDTLAFGYAIAVFDNAGSYENDNKFKDFMRVVVGFTDLIGLTKDKNRDALQEAKNYNSLGELNYAFQKYKTAEKNFAKAQKLFESHQGTNTAAYAQLRANQGLLFHHAGRYTEAEELSQQALTLRKQIVGEKSPAYAASLNNIGMIYRDRGKYTEAEKSFALALQITQQLPQKDSVAYAIMLNNQGMLYQMIGRVDESVNLLTESLKIADPLLKRKSPTFQRLQVNLALIYQEMGKYAEAEKLYQDAIKTKELLLTGFHPDVAHIKNHLASLYMQMADYERVKKLLNEALLIFELKMGKRNVAYASTLANLGNYYRNQGNLPQALKNLNEALKTYQAILGENHPTYNRCEEDLALTYWQAGDYVEAGNLFRKVLKRNNEFIRRYFPPMSESEKAKYWRKLQPTYLKFYSFVAEYAEKDARLLVDLYNAHLVTKAILLSVTTKIRQNILNSGDSLLIQNYQIWVKQKEDLAKLYSFSKIDLIEQNIDLDSLEKANNDLEKQLSAKFPLLENEITFQDIVQNLQADEATLDIISFKKFNKTFGNEIYYLALIASPEKPVPQLVSLKNGVELDGKFFKNYRNSIQFKKTDKFSYEQYWAKIEPFLANKSKIYVTLDGAYNQLNINTLRNSKGNYLLDEKDFIFLTNPKDLINLKKNKPIYDSKQAVLVGFPDYGVGGKIPALNATLAEVDTINGLLMHQAYETSVLTAKKAQESSLKTIQNPRILHLATHGFFLNDVSDFGDKVFGIEIDKAKENPLLRCGLMFANAENAINNQNELRNEDNGILTAYEAMNLHLKTEIVLLSACETGLGEVIAGEGVYGLQRAFQIAGADVVIMSLWTVNDTATQELMTLFYQNWLVSGNKVSAFKQAQQTLKQKYPEPYYWGAFVMIGG